MSVTTTAGPAGSRGCGKPKKNGVYIRGSYVEDGVPITQYMHCHPRPFDIKLPTRGVLIRKGPDGNYHAFKRVGLKHYPSCYGWALELIRKGPSVLIKKETDLSLLGPDSKLVLVHPRAIIENANEYLDKMKEEINEYSTCSINIASHNGEIDKGQTCMRHWQCDMHMEGNDNLHAKGRFVAAHEYFQGDMRFWAHPRHADITPIYKPGIVAAVPMSIVVEDGDKAQGIVESLVTKLEVTLNKTS